MITTDHRHSWKADPKRCSICGLTRGRQSRAYDDRRLRRISVSLLALAMEKATDWITFDPDPDAKPDKKGMVRSISRPMTAADHMKAAEAIAREYAVLIERLP